MCNWEALLRGYFFSGTIFFYSRNLATWKIAIFTKKYVKSIIIQKGFFFFWNRKKNREIIVIRRGGIRIISTYAELLTAKFYVKWQWEKQDILSFYVKSISRIFYLKLPKQFSSEFSVKTTFCINEETVNFQLKMYSFSSQFIR